MLLTATNTTDFNQFEVDPVDARYIKLMGYGRFNSVPDNRTSVWSAVGEIEFYGSDLVSINENEYVEKPFVYPVPVNDLLHIRNINQVDLITIYGMDGRNFLNKKIDRLTSEVNLNVSSFANGSYIINLKGEKINQSELLIIAH